MRPSEFKLPAERSFLAGNLVLLWQMNDAIQFPVTWLAEEELTRLQLISDPLQALWFRQSRGLLRLLLAHLLNVSPESICFAIQPHGKPTLATHSLAFNLSHSHHWLAIAVSFQYAIGIDIELTMNRRQRPWLSIAKRFFTPNEYHYLSSLPQAEQAAAFSSFWTQKEAVLKALGAGINAGLHNLDLLSHQHSLDTNTYRVEFGTPLPQLECAISTQNNSAQSMNYYILTEQLEIQPLQPPYISHLCLKPNSL